MEEDDDDRNFEEDLVDDTMDDASGKRPDPVFVLLQGDGAFVVDPKMVEQLHEHAYFGKIDPNSGLLHLHPEEVMVFSERNRLIALKDKALDEARLLIGDIQTRWEEFGYEAFVDDSRFLNTEELFKYFQENVPDFWEQYVVYRDLKVRGYIVRRGVKDIAHFRVFKKGTKKGLEAARYIFFGVFEGKPVPLAKLREISEYARSNRQELILAVVDRHMDLSYYSLKQQEL